MFASENLLLHDVISTLELKSNSVRWYAKEAILTDRALYLYKQRSNYVHDAHQRLTLAKYRAQRPKTGAPIAYQADLPPMEAPYEVLVELLNKETSKKKIVACQSDEKAQRFVQLFNLVSAFSYFDDHVSSQRQLQETSGASAKGEFGLPSKADQKRIEQWVQNYVLGHEEQQGETMAFANESVAQCSHLLRILGQYFKDTVTALAFSNNSLGDAVLQAQLFPRLQSFPRLQKLELTHNRLTAASLTTLGDLFQTCQQLTDINLSSNFIGGGQRQGSSGERECVDYFLSKLLTELQRPRLLDLSYNSLTDECLYPVVKYVFANHESRLESLNLENNRFSPFASRTLLKAYSISPHHGTLSFKFGPLPLGLENLRAGFVTPQDQECITVLAAEPAGESDLGSAAPGRPVEHAHSGEATRGNRSVEVVIQRRSNNFSESGNVLRRAPVARVDSQKMDHYLARIEETVQKREEIEIEELRAFVHEVTSGDVEFEIPRYRLEPIFNVVNEKLEAAMEHENIYMLEVLLDCLKFMNARNIPAEKKYYELASEAQVIVQQLLKVLNLEIKDETEMQRLLVLNLRRGKQIGLRGELIDTARHLYLLTEKVLGEMRGQAAAVSDDEDEAIYEVNEEDRPPNVYDARLDKYIDMKPELLGLTSDVEAHLAGHPYSTDYLKLANLNLNYVRKNLAEAKRFLKDEESYAYRNIFERCSVLLSDAGEQSAASITYNLARNDPNLKLARLVFRYKNNLDKLFPFKAERVPRFHLEQLRHQDFREPSPDLINNVANYAELRSPDLLASREPTLECSLTKLDTSASLEAVRFNRKLVEVLKGDAQAASAEAKLRFYTDIQELFEEFVIQGVRTTGARKLGLLNRELSDEFYLQLYRLADLHMAALAQKQGMKEFFNTMLLFALLSNYCAPQSRRLYEGLLHWLLQMRATMQSQEALRRIVARAISNFQVIEIEEAVAGSSQADQDPDLEEDDYGDPDEQSGARPSSMAPESRFENNATALTNWPPSKLEIDSLITGQPIFVQVHLSSGELVTHAVDEATTVEMLFDQVCDGHPHLKGEHEAETFWLYRLHNPHIEGTKVSGACLDFPLPKDKKVLKLMYQAEREGVLQKQSEAAIDSMKVRLAQSVQRHDAPGKNGRSGVAALDLQKCQFIVKRRVFPSLFVYKNFRKLHERGLEQAFYQLRSDHVDKNILQDVCAPDDIIFFGALILKVKLQSNILRSKMNKISSDLLLKHIDYAIPSCFIERDSLSSGGHARAPQHWVQKIEDGYFRKKEFLDYSSQDAQEKFLSGIGLYSIMFSSYFVVKKGGSDKREAEAKSLMSRIAASKNVGPKGAAIDSDDESVATDSQVQSDSDKRQFTIDEANSSDENSESSSGDDSQSTAKKRARVGAPKRKGTLQAPSRSKAQLAPGSSIWSQIQDEDIFLIVNLQGIQVAQSSKRDKILLHIDFSDILYVMGKGHRLKIGFIMQHSNVLNANQTFDFRTEFNTARLAGHKARSIAEDIIAYSQLRLLEMTKNDTAEFVRRNYAAVFLDRIDGDHKPQADQSSVLSEDPMDQGAAEETLQSQPPAEQAVRPVGNTSFKGLQDMVITPADMLDSFDLEDNSEFMNDIGQTKIAEKLKDLSSAERYAKEIQAQLGNALRCKTENFFIWQRRYPLYTVAPHDPDASRVGASYSASFKNASALSSERNVSALSSGGQPPQPAPKPRVGGSFSTGNQKFTLLKGEHSVIEEQKSEDSSMAKEEPPKPEPPKPKAPVLSNFLQEFNQMNKKDTPSASSVNTDSAHGIGSNMLSHAQPKANFNTTSTANLFSEMKKSEGSVKFLQIEDEKERESAATAVLGQALMMAPTFD